VAVVANTAAALAAALSVELVSSSPAVAATGAPTDNPSPLVRIAGSHWIMDAPTKVAAAEGYFNVPGHEEPRVEASYHASGRDALAALLRGEAEYALVAPTPVARALLDHLDYPDQNPAIVVLASLGISSASHYIIARRDRGIQQKADLKGKRLGLLKKSSAHFSWNLTERLYGLEEGSVILVDLPVQEQAVALSAGDVDAVLSWDPYASRLRTSLDQQAVVFVDRAVASPNWLLVSRLTEVQGRPRVAERIVDAYRRAIQLVEADPPRAAQLVKTQLTTGSGAPDLTSTGLFWNLALDWAVVSNLEEQMRWWRRLDGVEGQPPAVPASYVWAGPLRAVAPESVVLPESLLRHPHAAKQSVRQ